MNSDTAHSKYAHVYVVLRIDEFSVASAVEDRVSAVSVYSTREAADREAERLRGLPGGEESRYVVLTSRQKG